LSAPLQEILNRYLLPRLGLTNSADPGSTGSSFDSATSKEVLATVADLSNYTKSHQVNLVILYWDLRDETQSSEVEYARDKLFAFAKNNNIVILRPKDFIAQHGGGSLFRDAIHPNAEGNKMIANFVFSKL